MNKPTLYIMCGIPGSGKSWYAQNVMVKDNVVYVSRDQIRFKALDKEDEYFCKEDAVYKTFIKNIKDGLDTGKDVIADATHLNWNSRHKLLNALGVGQPSTLYNVIPVVMRTDLNTAMDRNDTREGRACVPRSVIRRMNYQFTDPASDPYEYTSIMRVGK